MCITLLSVLIFWPTALKTRSPLSNQMYPNPVLCSSFLRLIAQISHITFPVCRLQKNFNNSPCSVNNILHQSVTTLPHLGGGAVGCRHCATSLKVAGSIPDGVIWIFHFLNPSGGTMALGSNQPLTEMSTRDVSWGLRRPVRTADNLTTFMCRLSINSWSLTLLEPQGPVEALLLPQRLSSSHSVAPFAISFL
jgi:hypothetical protein